MSNYFNKFPKNLYKFGDAEDPVYFQRLSKYVDLIDIVRDDIGTYVEYEIMDFERPDTLSHTLYGKSDYDWTFFLMNERLRETGWPMTLQQVYDTAQNDFFPNYTVKLDITTADSCATYAERYPVGQEVLIGNPNRSGVVVSKNLGVGEITVSSDSDVAGTYLSYVGVGISEPVSSIVYEFSGTHHYKSSASGEEVDFFFDAVTKYPVTNLEYLIAQNDESKKIRVIKKDSIEKIVGEFRRLTER